MLKIIILLVLSLLVLVPLIVWGITFKRSFTPKQGEIYLLQFFGVHWFTIEVGNPLVEWYQRLSFYILFWPYSLVSFTYEWVAEMTYAEYLEKVRIAQSTTDYAVSVAWEPQYRKKELNSDGTTKYESEVDASGMPIDKTVRILVSRKEKMISLKEIEGFALAVEFETEDGFRGWRLFTLMFKIEDLSKVVSKFRQWQKAASLKFQGEYNTWSKTVSYKVLRSTRLDDLLLTMGSNKGESFIKEINETVSGFGFTVIKALEGPIYLALETQDMLESQEKPKKAQDDFEAAQLEAKTKQTKADAEAGAIKTIEKAKTEVLQERTTIGVTAAKNLSKLTVDQNRSKFGLGGLAAMKGTYVENQSNGSASGAIDTTKLLENILAYKIVHNEN